MQKLLSRGSYNAGLRPSGHVIPEESFKKNNNGAIPGNFLETLFKDDDSLVPGNVIAAANTSSNSEYMRRCRQYGIHLHPARFVQAIPDFFINFLTEPGDWVVDPFAGSNMVGRVAESNERYWLTAELDRSYWIGSMLRFDAGTISDSLDKSPTAHQSLPE